MKIMNLAKTNLVNIRTDLSIAPWMKSNYWKPDDQINMEF